MDYDQMAEEAESQNTAEQVTCAIVSWEKPDEYIVGKVVSIKPFDNSKFETKCNQYILDTDEGRVSTVLGQATDKQIEGTTIIDKVVKIVFRGKGDLEDGRKFNKFEVKIIPVPEEDIPGKKAPSGGRGR